MIDRKESDGPWLNCDLCEATFWATGLEKASHIRGAAKDLEGWYRRRWFRIEDLDVPAIYVDLCPACGNEHAWTAIRFFDAAIRSDKARRHP